MILVLLMLADVSENFDDAAVTDTLNDADIADTFDATDIFYDSGITDAC